MNLQTLLPAALAGLSILSAACESTSSGGDGGVTEDGGGTTDGAAPATADWTFRPSPNGFVFENYTNMANPANLTAEEMRRLVGPAACEGGAASGACDLVPQARQWMEAQNQSMNSGHCEGMAVLAAHIFAGALRASDFGADTPFALMLDGNTALQREIAFWFSTQSTLPQLERRDLTPSALVDVLSADLARGNRPSFSGAAEPERARTLFERFCTTLASEGVPVATGVFGARMRVELVNDGPVTLLLG